MENVIFTNMCMIYDDKGNVLVQDRISSKWPGITFPGGHVENGESFVDSVIREVYEETGLYVTNLQLCGLQDWMKDENTRYVVFFYKTNAYTGKIRSSDEGEVLWVPLEKLLEMNLSNGMVTILKVFCEDAFTEQFFYKENDKWIELLK